MKHCTTYIGFSVAKSMKLEFFCTLLFRSTFLKSWLGTFSTACLKVSSPGDCSMKLPWIFFLFSFFTGRSSAWWGLLQRDKDRPLTQMSQRGWNGPGWEVEEGMEQMTTESGIASLEVIRYNQYVCMNLCFFLSHSSRSKHFKHLYYFLFEAIFLVWIYIQ